MGLTTAIGVLEGTNHPMFAIALVFSLIVSLAPCCWLPCLCKTHARQHTARPGEQVSCALCCSV